VDAIFWAALGFLIVAIVLGTAFVGLRAWRTWQAFLSLAVVGAAAADLVVARSERAIATSDRTAAKVAELDAAYASLERSRARARVLVGAVEEMLDAIRPAVRTLPRK
jgi:hypothetical protein